MDASSSWSRLPQLTPMRTALSSSIAVRIMKANLSSPLAPLPTLPGLIRYLASAFAQSGYSFSSRSPLKWKSPTSGTSQPISSSRRRMSATWAAASGELTVMRTTSEPACASWYTCSTVAAASAVSVLVIDCTTTGASEPTKTWPTRTWRVRRRAMFTLSIRYPTHYLS